MDSYNNELLCDVNKKINLHNIFDAWQETGQYIPYAFSIANIGYFGTINGLRLGTTKDTPV